VRYFIFTLNDCYQLEQEMKNGKTDTVFQAIIYKADYIKRLTWFLLKLDINFSRKPLGSGITIFYIDMDVPFFLSSKEKGENDD